MSLAKLESIWIISKSIIRLVWSPRWKFIFDSDVNAGFKHEYSYGLINWYHRLLKQVFLWQRKSKLFVCKHESHWEINNLYFVGVFQQTERNRKLFSAEKIEF